MNRAQSGYTLVELMVALLLLVVALMGLASAFPISRVTVQYGSAASTAVSLGRQTLEGMRNRRYSELTDEITTANFPSQGYGAIPGFGSFRRTVTIEDGVPEATCTPPPGTPCTKRVTVTVFFRDDAGLERSVAVRTIFVR